MEMIDVCFAMCVNANIEFYSPPPCQKAHELKVGAAYALTWHFVR